MANANDTIGNSLTREMAHPMDVDRVALINRAREVAHKYQLDAGDVTSFEDYLRSEIASVKVSETEVENPSSFKRRKIGEKFAKFVVPQALGLATKYGLKEVASVAGVSTGPAGAIASVAIAGLVGGVVGGFKSARDLRAAAKKGEEGLTEFYAKNVDVKGMYKDRRGLGLWFNLGKNKALESVFGFQRREDEIIARLNLNSAERDYIKKNGIIPKTASLKTFFERVSKNELYSLFTDLLVQEALLAALTQRKDLTPEVKVLLDNWLKTIAELQILCEMTIHRFERGNVTETKFTIKVSREEAAMQIQAFGRHSGEYGLRRGITSGVQAAIYNVALQAVIQGISGVVEHLKDNEAITQTTRKINEEVGQEVANIMPTGVDERLNEISAEIDRLEKHLASIPPETISTQTRRVVTETGSTAKDRALAAFGREYIDNGGMDEMGRWARIGAAQAFQDQYDAGLDNAMNVALRSPNAAKYGITNKDDLLAWMMNRGSIDGEFQWVGTEPVVTVDYEDMLGDLVTGPERLWWSVEQGANANVDSDWLMKVMKPGMGEIVQKQVEVTVENPKYSDDRFNTLLQITKLLDEKGRLLENAPKLSSEDVVEIVRQTISDEQAEQIANGGASTIDWVVDGTRTVLGAAGVALGVAHVFATEEAELGGRRKVEGYPALPDRMAPTPPHGTTVPPWDVPTRPNEPTPVFTHGDRSTPRPVDLSRAQKLNLPGSLASFFTKLEGRIPRTQNVGGTTFDVYNVFHQGEDPPVEGVYYLEIPYSQEAFVLDNNELYKIGPSGELVEVPENRFEVNGKTFEIVRDKDYGLKINLVMESKLQSLGRIGKTDIFEDNENPHELNLTVKLGRKEYKFRSLVDGVGNVIRGLVLLSIEGRNLVFDLANRKVYKKEGADYVEVSDPIEVDGKKYKVEFDGEKIKFVEEVAPAKPLRLDEKATTLSLEEKLERDVEGGIAIKSDLEHGININFENRDQLTRGQRAYIKGKISLLYDKAQKLYENVKNDNEINLAENDNGALLKNALIYSIDGSQADFFAKEYPLGKLLANIDSITDDEMFRYLTSSDLAPGQDMWGRERRWLGGGANEYNRIVLSKFLYHVARSLEGSLLDDTNIGEVEGDKETQLKKLQGRLVIESRKDDAINFLGNSNLASLDIETARLAQARVTHLYQMAKEYDPRVNDGKRTFDYFESDNGKNLGKALLLNLGYDRTQVLAGNPAYIEIPELLQKVYLVNRDELLDNLTQIANWKLSPAAMPANNAAIAQFLWDLAETLDGPLRLVEDEQIQIDAARVRLVAIPRHDPETDKNREAFDAAITAAYPGINGDALARAISQDLNAATNIEEILDNIRIQLGWAGNTPEEQAIHRQMIAAYLLEEVLPESVQPLLSPAPAEVYEIETQDLVSRVRPIPTTPKAPEPIPVLPALPDDLDDPSSLLSFNINPAINAEGALLFSQRLRDAFSELEGGRTHNDTSWFASSELIDLMDRWNLPAVIVGQPQRMHFVLALEPPKFQNGAVHIKVYDPMGKDGEYEYDYVYYQDYAGRPITQENFDRIIATDRYALTALNLFTNDAGHDLVRHGNYNLNLEPDDLIGDPDIALHIIASKHPRFQFDGSNCGPMSLYSAAIRWAYKSGDNDFKESGRDKILDELRIKILTRDEIRQRYNQRAAIVQFLQESNISEFNEDAKLYVSLFFSPLILDDQGNAFVQNWEGQSKAFLASHEEWVEEQVALLRATRENLHKTTIWKGEHVIFSNHTEDECYSAFVGYLRQPINRNLLKGWENLTIEHLLQVCTNKKTTYLINELCMGAEGMLRSTEGTGKVAPLIARVLDGLLDAAIRNLEIIKLQGVTGGNVPSAGPPPPSKPSSPDSWEASLTQNERAAVEDIFDKAGERKMEEVFQMLDFAIQRMEEAKNEGQDRILSSIDEMIGTKEVVYDGGVVYLPEQDGHMVIIGDIHGDAAAVKQIIRKSHFIENHESGPGNMVLVFQGDYFDRGRKQPEVLEILLALFNRYGPSAVVIKRADHDGVNLDVSDHDFSFQLRSHYFERENRKIDEAWWDRAYNATDGIREFVESDGYLSRNLDVFPRTSVNEMVDATHKFLVDNDYSDEQYIEELKRIRNSYPPDQESRYIGTFYYIYNRIWPRVVRGGVMSLRIGTRFQDIFTNINTFFDMLPEVGVAGTEILMFHGGIPFGDVGLDELKNNDYLLESTVWGDPASDEELQFFKDYEDTFGVLLDEANNLIGKYEVDSTLGLEIIFQGTKILFKNIDKLKKFAETLTILTKNPGYFIPNIKRIRGRFDAGEVTTEDILRALRYGYICFSAQAREIYERKVGAEFTVTGHRAPSVVEGKLVQLHSTGAGSPDAATDYRLTEPDPKFAIFPMRSADINVNDLDQYVFSVWGDEVPEILRSAQTTPSVPPPLPPTLPEFEEFTTMPKVGLEEQEQKFFERQMELGLDVNINPMDEDNFTKLFFNSLYFIKELPKAVLVVDDMSDFSFLDRYNTWRNNALNLLKQARTELRYRFNLLEGYTIYDIHYGERGYEFDRALIRAFSRDGNIFSRKELVLASLIDLSQTISMDIENKFLDKFIKEVASSAVPVNVDKELANEYVIKYLDILLENAINLLEEDLLRDRNPLPKTPNGTNGIVPARPNGGKKEGDDTPVSSPTPSVSRSALPPATSEFGRTGPPNRPTVTEAAHSQPESLPATPPEKKTLEQIIEEGFAALRESDAAIRRLADNTPDLKSN